MSDALREWEPRLELYLPPRHARLFEPDGTLYAVALSGPVTVTAGRREQEVARGDAIVVPEGLALDVEPEADLLGVRYDGPPPDHFRERFIQVWGFEHFAAREANLRSVRGFSRVIDAEDVRHRISYVVLDPSLRHEDRETGLDVEVLLGLEGASALHFLGERPGRAMIGPSRAVAVGPGLRYRLEGESTVGVLTLATEIAHQARRARRIGSSRTPPSPEYHPGSGGDGSPRGRESAS